jgi:hypothetical protein
MPFKCARGAWAKNEEPSIDEVLVEPVVQAMMARDGVGEAEVRRLLTQWSERGAREQAELGAVVASLRHNGLSRRSGLS